AFMPLAGCASIMHGTTQGIGLSSNPTNARITVDNQPMGQTPTVVKLSRKDTHIVRIELEGYQPFETALTRNVSGWVVGNLVFGGVVGLAVDAITGGLYSLSPETITAQMANAQVEHATDGLYLTVVLAPDPAWQKIGQLTRE
ncbi:MAG TPA: PEGA domain-containing protein, partial [Gemmatimonadaceae bacterium]|nr:PEGA domain-containing protein [Gemmatimonadaceae bacterium]